MSAVGLVSAGEDGYDDGGDADNELADYLQQIYAIQNYVADYVEYRVHLYDERFLRIPEPSKQLSDERYVLMRAVALIFEKTHVAELRNMVASLCRDRWLSFQRYIEVVKFFAYDDDESMAQMSYGRMVALIAFAGMVATCLWDKRLYSEISMIAAYTAKFLQKRITLTWQQNERSWEQFFELAKTIIKMNDEEDSERILSERRPTTRWCWQRSIATVAVLGILGISIFSVMKITLRVR